jgi:Domain of unknown function DUF29
MLNLVARAAMGTTLYDKDFFAWTQQQAAALRRAASGREKTRASGLDWEHLAEEIEELGGRDRRVLESDLARVIEHLLKRQYSPSPDPAPGWRRSVIEHRDRVRAAVEDSGALAAQLPSLLPRAWRRARKLAAAGLAEDGVDSGALPEGCPYSLEQSLDEDWYPPAAAGPKP